MAAIPLRWGSRHLEGRNVRLTDQRFGLPRRRMYRSAETMLLTILVTYCSNERIFVDSLLKAALHAADTVCVAVGRRLFDGQDEDVKHIMEVAGKYPRAHFVWYDVPDELLVTPVVLHNNARIAARDLASEVSGGNVYTDSWVILLDADEVPRDGGSGLKAWWIAARDQLDRNHSYKLSNRWFFLHPRLVSVGLEDSIVLVHASQLSDKAMSHPRERDGVCFSVSEGGGTCFRGVRGIGGLPMFDHFSWVRSDRSMLIAKVKNWGHSGERDWKALINHAFDELEQGRFPETDFVHGRKLILLAE